MLDPSGLTNATGNAGRGYTGQQSPGDFSSLGNLFRHGAQSGAGTGSAAMNLMPGNPGAQPGMNLPGFMQFLGRTFGGGSNFQDYMGSSWQQSPLGQVFSGRQAAGAPPPQRRSSGGLY